MNFVTVCRDNLACKNVWEGLGVLLNYGGNHLTIFTSFGK